MSVRERCETVSSAVVGYEALRLSAKDAEVHHHRAKEMRELRESILADLARLDALRQKGVPLAPLPNTEKCIEWLEKCSSAFDAGDPKAGSAFGNAKRTIKTVAKDLRSVVESSVGAIVKALPAVDEAFLRQVETVPAFSRKVADIRRRRDELGKGVNPSSMSATELLRFLDERDSLSKLADELHPEDFPPEVLEFYRAARGRRGATIDKLTDGVKEWLAERGELDSIRIRVEG